MSRNSNTSIDYAEKPLIYSCSGCSSAAQLANHLAVRLDRLGDADLRAETMRLKKNRCRRQQLLARNA